METRHITTYKKPTSSVQTLSRELRSLAVTKGPDTKLPTVRQLCRELNTSTRTLDAALSELEAQSVVYRVQGSGIYVSPRINEKTIALVVGLNFYQSRKGSPFWDNLLALMIQESPNRANSQNERFAVHIGVPSGNGKIHLPKNFVHDVEAGLVHGVIAICLDDEASFQWIYNHRIPMAAFGGAGWPQVDFDGAMLIRTAVQELLHQGCRRVGFWAPYPFEEQMETESLGRAAAREHAAFADTLVQHDAPFDPALIEDNRLVARSVLTNEQQGNAMGEKLIAAPVADRPDGIVISNDMLTVGVLTALRESDIKIGRDLKIATHANVGSHVFCGYDKVLTTVVMDPLEIVWTMYEMLDIQMAGGEVESPKMVGPRLSRP